MENKNSSSGGKMPTKKVIEKKFFPNGTKEENGQGKSRFWIFFAIGVLLVALSGVGFIGYKYYKMTKNFAEVVSDANKLNEARSLADSGEISNESEDNLGDIFEVLSENGERQDTVENTEGEAKTADDGSESSQSWGDTDQDNSQSSGEKEENDDTQDEEVAEYDFAADLSFLSGQVNRIDTSDYDEIDLSDEEMGL